MNAGSGTQSSANKVGKYSFTGTLKGAESPHTTQLALLFKLREHRWGKIQCHFQVQSVAAAPKGTVHAGGNGRSRAQRFSPHWGNGRQAATPVAEKNFTCLASVIIYSRPSSQLSPSTPGATYLQTLARCDPFTSPAVHTDRRVVDSQSLNLCLCMGFKQPSRTTLQWFQRFTLMFQ